MSRFYYGTAAPQQMDWLHFWQRINLRECGITQTDVEDLPVEYQCLHP